MEALPLLRRVGLISTPLTNSSSSPIQFSIPLHLHLPNGNRKTKLRSPQSGRGTGFGNSSISDEKRRPPEEEDEDGSAPAAKASKDDGDEEIPQVVFDRMIRRIIFAVGSPMALGVGLLNVESFLVESQAWRVPGWLPLLTILLSFGTSALGIAYGTLSTSMDPDREGSFLGWAEAEKNWPELWKE